MGQKATMNATVVKPKFDLLASLKKPLSWKPYVGKLKPLEISHKTDVKAFRVKSSTGKKVPPKYEHNTLKLLPAKLKTPAPVRVERNAEATLSTRPMTPATAKVDNKRKKSFSCIPVQSMGRKATMNATVVIPKFDLSASLKKPLSWKPYVGKLKPLEISHKTDVKAVKVKSRTILPNSPKNWIMADGIMDCVNSTNSLSNCAIESKLLILIEMINLGTTDEIMINQSISALLLTYLNTGDVVGAGRLLEKFKEQDRKSIVAKIDNCDAPLFVAVMRGNVDIVKCLVTEWQADMEEVGEFFDRRDGYSLSVTPLWCAVFMKRLEIVKLLIDLGADINAVSNTGYTPVSYACFREEVRIVQILLTYGADVQKPNNDGETCLTLAAGRSKELCQILIDYGAEVNAQNSLGNTALHCALISENNPDKFNIVELLIDHGSNPYMKNKQGDDVFRTACLECQDLILRMLLARVLPPVERSIESFELLGASHVIRNPSEIGIALYCWKTSVEMREMHSCINVHASQPNPVYLNVQEVNTVEELKVLSRNPDLIHMHALLIFERILGPHHCSTIYELLGRGSAYLIDDEYRRGLDIYRYALQLLNIGGNPLTASVRLCSWYMPILYTLSKMFCFVYRECQRSNSNSVDIKFDEVFEVLQMAIVNIENSKGIIISQEYHKTEDYLLDFMKSIIHLMSLITNLEMNADQLISFRTIVYRLVRCQLKTNEGKTLLHLSVVQCLSGVNLEFSRLFHNTAVVEVLLECGAKVNAIDDEHSTALHLCSQFFRIPDIVPERLRDLIKRIVVLLLKNSAHVDMVNIFGKRAVDGLTSSLMEMNRMNFVSLKCLAANAVAKYKIPYVGHLVGPLESFVHAHGICGPNCNFLRKCVNI